MDIQQRYAKVKQLLEKHNQSHLLTFWPGLNEKQKHNLLLQIERLEFNRVEENINRYIRNPAPLGLPKNFSAAPVYPAVPQTAQQKEKYEKAKKLGVELISGGKAAAFVVAGGQGTRLGFDRPKGDFAVSPVKKKTLFRLFAEQIAAAGVKYNFQPRWYIMTSPLNHQQTLEIFRRNNFYGLESRSVFIFQQGTEVNFSTDGGILLAEKDTLSASPDGHGGSLKALYKSGAAADMKEHGIEYISYFQVDNPLINIFDSLFIGLHAMDKAEMSSKAVVKTGPFEKVGNFCLVEGKIKVLEYSDFLSDELLEKKNPDGSLIFSLGSIAIHIISREFVDQLNNKGFALPYHKAVKKIPYIDLQSGKKIEPRKPSGIKLETFVFDALPLAQKSIILETLRSEEFAPVKNKTGIDSTEVARQMMINRAAQWLAQAGVKIPRKPDGSIDCRIEIAQSFAICKEDIANKKDKIPKIKPGDVIYLE
ncbi:MAG: UTP--glucose-1-phosphate uridylyltransferase [Sedimentisphaerales bacterium]